ncbi:hypothetical protein JD844_015071 [Phrynosoma platyrhinos]|uniref:GATS-like protein 3 n=1 Tax=Phrynosoma platyrhinos TaxID=52577 RepID=A0ABQ7T719_PHRPL|nr:hypothetical protein JD844_015071 [Phrynosoma platyrhinos]
MRAGTFVFQVREKDLPVVIHTLASEFDIYKEVNGEPVPANCEDTSNGFFKPKQGGPAKESASEGDGPDSFTFFAFSLIEGYISIVMDAETKKKFPSDLLLTSSSGELWRMVRIGGQPLGFDECGIVAQIAEPLADADISAYYISTFNFDHALVPEEGIDHVTEVLQKRQESGR